MKKVLILTYYFPPMGMGGTQRAAKFVKYLPEFGWQPQVITVRDVAYYAKDETFEPDIAAARVIRTGSLDPQRLLYLLRSCRGSVPRGHSSANYQAGVINRVLNWLFIPDTKLLWLPFALIKAVRVMRRQDISCLLTSSPPHSIHLLGWLLKKVTGVRWVADFRDGWTSGDFQYEPTRLHRSVNEALQRLVLGSADQVVSVSRRLTDKLKASLPFEQSRFHTIYNGFDAQDFEKPDSAKHTPGQFHILFAGALTRMTPMVSFLRALRTFLRQDRTKKPRIAVKLVGAVLDEQAQNLVQVLDLQKNVTFTGYLNHRHAVAEMCSTDLLLYPVSDEASPDFIPGKTFEYLATGKPVLAIGPRVEGIELLEKHGCVKRVAHANDQAIVEAIEYFYSEWQKGGTDKVKQPRIDDFERRQLTEKLTNVLDSNS